MTDAIKVGKSGVNAETATDPNDFIFHSDYNTLKILGTGLYEPSIPADSSTTDYTVAHEQETAPMVMAFMREGTSDEVVFSNNITGLVGSHLNFSGVKTDSTNIIFRISNDDPDDAITAHIRYFIFEVPL